MIPVRETSPGVFEPVEGNPVLFSLDGKVQAPLQTIMAPSWSAEDRAAFGVYAVELAPVPEGKQSVSHTYAKQGDGVVMVRTLEDIPPADPRPDPIDDLRSTVEALAARVLALERAKA